MLHSLRIANFQSHKDSFLEFSTGINIIVGRSDAGKSSILRAIKWLADNKPSGDAFRSTWGGETMVTLKIGRAKLSRYKDKSNQYILKYPKKPAQSFHSFGQDVPNDIKQILNFSSLTQSEQLESPFLLAMSGGEVARYLNKIVHLDVIDKSLSNIGRTIHNEKIDLKHKKQDLEDTENKLKEYSWIEEAEGCVVKLELFQNQLAHKKVRVRTLTSIVDYLEKWKGDKTKLEELTQHEGEVYKLIRENEAVENKKEKIERLRASITYLKSIKSKIETTKNFTKVNEREFKKLMPETCPLCEK